LITGSTQRGIETLARRIHGAGQRAKFPFVGVSARDFPTAAEAFGIAAVEASAAGLAAIVTAVGGLKDIVVNGDNGFLIQPGDIQSLSEHLRLLAGDAKLRERMGKAARQRAEKYFDARRNAERIVSRLLEIVRKESDAGNSA
jgi:glycosyltransferase involved in cell wall biosynthesis